MSITTQAAIDARRVRRGIQRRLISMRRWPISSFVVIGAIILAAVFAPWVTSHDPIAGNLADRQIPPLLFGGSSAHVLGTDNLGRDILSRIAYGARISVLVATITLGVGGALGSLIGLISGYAGGWVDELIMRMVDIKFSLPLILIALALAVILGPSLPLLLGLLAFLIWGSFARQARAQTMLLKEMDYVKLAKVAGASPVRVVGRHILPGVMNTILVVATMQVGSVILAEASLSFLGAGVPPPTPSWGSMVAEGRLYINTAWWVSLVPGLVIGLLVASTTLLGDWLRDRLDPRLRQAVADSQR